MAGTASMLIVNADDVLNAPAFEELARTQGVETPSAVREFIAEACQGISDAIEVEAGRWLRKQQWTEVLDGGRSGRARLKVHAWPIDRSQPIAIRYSPTGEFDGLAPIEPTLYACPREGRSGVIELRFGARFYGGVGDIQVTYVGGLAEAPDKLPRELTVAVIEQVVFIAQRNATLHLSGESQNTGKGASGSATYYRAANWLPSLERAVDNLRR